MIGNKYKKIKDILQTSANLLNSSRTCVSTQIFAKKYMLYRYKYLSMQQVFIINKEILSHVSSVVCFLRLSRRKVKTGKQLFPISK